MIEAKLFVRTYPAAHLRVNNNEAGIWNVLEALVSIGRKFDFAIPGSRPSTDYSGTVSVDFLGTGRRETDVVGSCSRK